MIAPRIDVPWLLTKPCRSACVSLLVVVLLSLVPLAHASPVDLTWIPGLYDNGDGDEIVLLITNADAPPIPIGSFMVWSRIIVPVVPEPDTSVPDCRYRPASERAPPAV